MATCGIWLTPRSIVAAVVDDAGTAVGPALTGAATPDAVWALLSHVESRHGLDCRFVVTDGLLAAHPGVAQALARHGAGLLVVSAVVVEALRVLTGSARAPPRKRALLLARLPLCPPLRAHLAPLRLQLALC